MCDNSGRSLGGYRWHSTVIAVFLNLLKLFNLLKLLNLLKGVSERVVRVEVAGRGRL